MRGRITLLLVLLNCLTATTRLLTAVSYDNDDEDDSSGRYESSQRLWYPREAIKDEEATKPFRRTLIMGTKPGNFHQNWRPVGLKGPSMFEQAGSGWSPSALNKHMSKNHRNGVATRKRYADIEKRAARFIYMMSPLNEQIFEVGSQKVDGRGRFVDWPRQLPEVNLQGQTPAELARMEPLVSSASDSSSSSSSIMTTTNECQTLSAPVLITRDDVDKITGQLIRNCKGLIKLNKCEGSCGSLVQPSIKSSTGLKKECSCCNEGSFRQIQVRLTECYWAVENRLITSGEDLQRSYMDIELDEPIECRCHRCDSFVPI